MGSRIPTLTAWVALSACGSLGFETEVTNKEPFDPPVVYRTWWVATEGCSARYNIILVRGYETDEKTVRHEMLHDLLAGDASHADEAWSACGLIFD